MNDLILNIVLPEFVALSDVYAWYSTVFSQWGPGLKIDKCDRIWIYMYVFYQNNGYKNLL